MIRPLTTASRLEDALSVLNEAAREKRSELGRVLHGKCEDLKQAILKVEAETVERARESSHAAMQMGHEAVDRIRGAARTVDRRAHEEPWLILGCAVAGALTLGYLLGRRD